MDVLSREDNLCWRIFEPRHKLVIILQLLERFGFAYFVATSSTQRYVKGRTPLTLLRRTRSIQSGFRPRSAWPTGSILPILVLGSAIFASAYLYHLYSTVVAVGAVLITSGAVIATPVDVSYVCDGFRPYPEEEFDAALNLCYSVPPIDKDGF